MEFGSIDWCSILIKHSLRLIALLTATDLVHCICIPLSCHTICITFWTSEAIFSPFSFYFFLFLFFSFFILVQNSNFDEIPKNWIWIFAPKENDLKREFCSKKDEIKVILMQYTFLNIWSSLLTFCPKKFRHKLDLH